MRWQRGRGGVPSCAFAGTSDSFLPRSLRRVASRLRARGTRWTRSTGTVHCAAAGSLPSASHGAIPGIQAVMTQFPDVASGA
jgi:hypothetical protein